MDWQHVFEHLLNPSPDVMFRASRVLLTVASSLMWLAWFMLWRNKRIDTGGRSLALWWAFNSSAFLTVYTIARFYLGIMASLLPAWAAVCWIQAGVSVIFYIVTWNRIAKRRQSG